MGGIIPIGAPKGIPPNGKPKGAMPGYIGMPLGIMNIGITGGTPEGGTPEGGAPEGGTPLFGFMNCLSLVEVFFFVFPRSTCGAIRTDRRSRRMYDADELSLQGQHYFVERNAASRATDFTPEQRRNVV